MGISHSGTSESTELIAKNYKNFRGIMPQLKIKANLIAKKFAELNVGGLFIFGGRLLPDHEDIGVYVKISATRYIATGGMGGVTSIDRSSEVFEVGVVTAKVEDAEKSASAIAEQFLGWVETYPNHTQLAEERKVPVEDVYDLIDSLRKLLGVSEDC